ncbi:MAG: hypothetical protein NDJ92_01640 [Thermoanaerobaculia bacterium]|nr:hypothetical protein [Thermoanaerobaculia bacterium]
MNDSHSRETGFWFRAAGIVFVAAAIVSFFSGFYRAKYRGSTGEARWIWPDRKLSLGTPVAAFAVKEFEVPLNPPFVRIKIACDPEYTLYFNGTVVGRAIAGSASMLDVYDVTPLARQGKPNRIVVAVRSANGVGGLIASVDYAPIRENDVVSDGSWRFVAEWRDSLPEKDEGLRTMPVRELGVPPFGPWNDLELRPRELIASSPARIEPVAKRELSVPVRRLRVAGGVAIATSETEPATAWDFGEFSGRCVLDAPAGDAAEPRLLRIRYAGRLDELLREGAVREIALAPGERAVMDPTLVSARWVAVIGSGAIPVIVPDDGAGKERMPGE